MKVIKRIGKVLLILVSMLLTLNTEYLSSRESSCTMAKGLGNIVEKCKVSGDDKYYTLGMVQYICINMLSDEWEKPVLQQGVNLEDFLRNLW